MTKIGPLYDKTITCLVCNKSFKTKKIRSNFIKVIKSDSDFCTYYSDEETNPFFYYVTICPYCGFSMTNDFTPYFPPGTLDEIKLKISQNWAKQNYCGKRTAQSAINSYKLGVYSALLKREKHIILAGLYLRLAWLYRTYEYEEEEKRFLNLAREEYVDSYITDDYRGTKMTTIKLYYLIAELSHRIYDYDMAVKYLSKVIEKQDQASDRKIIELAKERWQEIRKDRHAHEIEE